MEAFYQRYDGGGGSTTAYVFRSHLIVQLLNVGEFTVLHLNKLDQFDYVSWTSSSEAYAFTFFS